MSKLELPMIVTGQGITIFLDGKTYPVNKDTPNYKLVQNAIDAGSLPQLRDALEIKRAIASHTEGRVSIIGDQLHYDGEPMRNAMSTRVMEMVRNGEFSVSPYLKFIDNLMLNPSESSKEELYAFLEACDLPITVDGHFLAYKRIRDDYKDIYTNTIDNSVGSTPTIEREAVNPDRNQTCSSGLHVCSMAYLPNFGAGSGNRVVVCKVNPRDVVTVPADYNNAKMRVASYFVVSEIPVDEAGDLIGRITPNYTTEWSYSDEDYDEHEDLDSWEDEEMDEWADEEESCEEHSSSDETNEAPAAFTASKLNEDGVRGIRKDLAAGKYTLTQIAEWWEVSPRQVARIRDREAWAWVK